MTHSFAESEDRVFCLEQEDVDGVGSFINWLYTGKYAVVSFESRSYLWEYQLADRFCCEGFCNTIVDVVFAKHEKEKHRMSKRILLTLYEIGLGDSTIAKLGLKQAVKASLCKPESWINKNAESLDTWLGQPQLLLDYATEVARYQKKPYPPSKDWNVCEFHTHATTSECSVAKAEEGK